MIFFKKKREKRNLNSLTDSKAHTFLVCNHQWIFTAYNYLRNNETKENITVYKETTIDSDIYKIRKMKVMYILDYFEHRNQVFYGRIVYMILKCLSNYVNCVHSKQLRYINNQMLIFDM